MLLFTDSFDHYGPVVDIPGQGKWASGSAFTNTTARTGIASANLTSSNTMTTKALPVSGGFVVGYAFRYTGSMIATNILSIMEGAVRHVTVAATVPGILTVTRNGTVLATGTTVLVPNNFYYLELKGTINDVTGSFELRIDGVLEVSGTNVDTNNGGTNWDRVEFRSAIGGANSTLIDDVYICDTSGPAPRNTFLGSIKVECLMPQTDAVAVGTYQQLTPSTGTDHGALVDEIPSNITDYNSSPTVGQKDTYQYPSMTLAGTIIGVQPVLYVQKTDAAVRAVCVTARIGGADFDGANISPNTTFTMMPQIWAQNPATAADWTVADINAAQFGMKVTV